jgi:large subunit ribosomal protein L15
MPLQRRLPKFGFKNINRVEYQVVNLSSIQKLAENGLEKVTIEDMVVAGLVSSKGLVKILGNGTLTAKVEVVANAFSKSAEEAIQNVGGTATKL